MRIAGLSRRTPGFTLVEMLVVVVLGAVVTLGLYRVLNSQQRAYRHQNALASLHDGLRVATAVLAADLREASATAGDLATLGIDSLVVRSPVGFAIVCAVDVPNRRLGLVNVHGRIDATVGDSVLVYRSAGWIVRNVLSVNPTGYPALSCPYASGPALQRTVRLNTSISGVAVGAPVRAFRRVTYKLVQEGGSWWLGRRAGSQTDLLAGPLAGSGLEFVYLDSLEQSTTNPAAVARVRVTVVARSMAASAGLAADATPLQDTLDWVVSLRNR